jgi:DNA polymerase III delta subunit
MRTVTIRDEIIERIEKIADHRQLPIDRQVEELLAESIERHEKTHNLRKFVESVAAMTPKGVVQTDAVVILREDRDR